LIINIVVLDIGGMVVPNYPVAPCRGRELKILDEKSDRRWEWFTLDRNYQLLALVRFCVGARYAFWSSSSLFVIGSVAQGIEEGPFALLPLLLSARFPFPAENAEKGTSRAE
jgi:hypothetical protein